MIYIIWQDCLRSWIHTDSTMFKRRRWANLFTEVSSRSLKKLSFETTVLTLLYKQYKSKISRVPPKKFWVTSVTQNFIALNRELKLDIQITQPLEGWSIILKGELLLQTLIRELVNFCCLWIINL